MTVKQLIDELTKFDDKFTVYVPYTGKMFSYAEAMNVSHGFNEYDGCVFIDDYVEDDDSADDWSED